MRQSLVFAVTAIVLSACGASGPTVANPTAGAAESVHAETKLAAVMVRADWCASCKILEPKVLDVRQNQQLEGLTHIVMDYTGRDRRDLFAQADAAGVGKAMRDEFADEVITGMLYLVDVDDQNIIGDVRNPTSQEEIEALIERKLRET